MQAVLEGQEGIRNLIPRACSIVDLNILLLALDLIRQDSLGLTWDPSYSPN